MAPRKRKYKQLEPNLYQATVKGKTYYRYQHPITGKYHGMGADRAKANAAARILNAKLIPDTDSLADRVLSSSDIAFSEVIDRFTVEILDQKQTSKGTRQNYQYRLKRFREDLGDKLVRSFTVKDCAEYLDANFERDSYIKHRGTLVELFRFAVVKGLIDSNPAEVTYAKSQQTQKQRQRMTISQYKAIHKAAPDWLKIAMELALVTLQGRWEVTHMRFDQIQDDSLYVVREKTKGNDWAHLKIQLTPQLQSIVQEARQSGIASPYIVHRRPQRVKPNKETDHWSQIAPNTFTAEFRKVRDSVIAISVIPKERRPTFHEIRALGSHLYEKAGYSRSYVQKLMAHGDEKMTEHYQSGHEQKWVAVEAGLDLDSLI